MPYRAMLVVLAAASLSLLSACDSNDMILHEPGVYKGKHDETATVEAAERRQDQLRERAMTGMTDR